jgi:hypothetical protein
MEWGVSCICLKQVQIFPLKASEFSYMQDVEIVSQPRYVILSSCQTPLGNTSIRHYTVHMYK